MTLQLSIILPAYDANAFITEKLLSLISMFDEELGGCYEVIVVDDGSVDGTFESVRQVAAAHPCVTSIRLPNNMGKGAAVCSGISSSRGRYVIFSDCDLPFGASGIKECYDRLLSGSCPLVFGDRLTTDSTYYNRISLVRKLASLAHIKIVGSFILGDVNDTQCGLKGFRGDLARELFRCITIKGFAFDVELWCLALTSGLKVDHMPVRLTGDVPTTVSFFRRILRMLYDVLRVFLRYSRGEYVALWRACEEKLLGKSLTNVQQSLSENPGGGIPDANKSLSETTFT